MMWRSGLAHAKRTADEERYSMERHEHPSITGQESAAVDSIQGEGDYRSAREYREDLKEFLEHVDVEKAAREAAPRNREEARELEQAEEEGRSRAKDKSQGADARTTGLSVERMQRAARSIKRTIQERPLTAIVIAAGLGYLVAAAGHLRQRALESRGR
jgi:ElaB/YqjD/DUF883 family membrane-anchored ribosome-binding protein